MGKYTNPMGLVYLPYMNGWFLTWLMVTYGKCRQVLYTYIYMDAISINGFAHGFSFVIFRKGLPGGVLSQVCQRAPATPLPPVQQELNQVRVYRGHGIGIFQYMNGCVFIGNILVNIGKLYYTWMLWDMYAY